MRKQRPYIALFLFLAVIVPVTLAIGSPGEGPRTPVILSATVDGDLLVIRGADLAAGAELEPFVTLSGEPLQIQPGFSEFEVRARLPRVPGGNYLLTVASDRNAPQAGVFSVSLSKQGVPEPTSHLPQPLLICANKRHMRVVQSRDKCKSNETFATLQTDASPDLSDSGDSDDDSDVDSDVDSDSDDVDSDADSADSDDDSGKGNGRGNGNGNGNGNGRGGDSDADSDSDD